MYTSKEKNTDSYRDTNREIHIEIQIEIQIERYKEGDTNREKNTYKVDVVDGYEIENRGRGEAKE